MKQELVLLRVWATVSVVLWHASGFPYIYGRVVENVPNQAYWGRLFSTLLPDNNMSWFTFLAGYLFYMMWDSGKYREFKPFLKKKFTRLVIPYLIITPIGIWSLPMIFSSFRPFFFNNGDFMTWYCAMLFWLFLIAWSIEKLNNRYIKWFAVAVNILLLLKSQSIYGGGRLPFCLGMAILSYIYFLIGGVIYRHKNQALRFLQKYRILIFLTYIILAIITFWNIAGLGGFSKCTMTVLSPIIAWYVAKLLANTKMFMPSKLTNEINRLSFGIYIIQSYLIVPILHIPFVAPFMAEHYFVFPVVNFIFLLCVSIVLANIAYRTRIGRFLFAG